MRGRKVIFPPESLCVVLVIPGLQLVKTFFYILLTAHLSIILANDQLDAQLIYFIIRLLQSSTCFEHRRARHQEVKLY